MVSKELSEAAVEINSIFDNMTADIISKIPQNVRSFFNKIASENYLFQYDKSKKLDEQELLPRTKGILALIYRDYLCNEDEKQSYIENCNKILMVIEKRKNPASHL